MGEWINGYQNGKGKLIYNDGTKYTGDFKDGMKHGNGYMVWLEGKHTYEGCFYRDKKHGLGKEKFSNGD